MTYDSELDHACATIDRALLALDQYDRANPRAPWGRWPLVEQAYAAHAAFLLTIRRRLPNLDPDYPDLEPLWREYGRDLPTITAEEAAAEGTWVVRDTASALGAVRAAIHANPAECCRSMEDELPRYIWWVAVGLPDELAPLVLCELVTPRVPWWRRLAAWWRQM